MWYELPVDFLFFGLAIYFLVKATNLVTDSLENIADSGNAAKFAITSFLGAIATSLPEMLVSVLGAIDGKPGLALGLILGSNIANITISVGMATAIGGGLSVLDKFVKKDVFRALIMTLFPIILMLDGELTRADGILLIMGFILYYVVMFRENTYEETFDFNVDDMGFFKGRSIFKRKGGNYRKKQLFWFVTGIAALLLSAEIVVRSGELLAFDLGLPMVLVGLFFVAFGTSLPEIVFGIKACIKKESGMVFGNLLGSLVSNSTLVLGLAVIIAPINISVMEKSSFLATMFYILSFLLLWFFIKTKLSLSRKEGIILALVYVIFIGMEYLLGVGV